MKVRRYEEISWLFFIYMVTSPQSKSKELQTKCTASIQELSHSFGLTMGLIRLSNHQFRVMVVMELKSVFFSQKNKMG